MIIGSKKDFGEGGAPPPAFSCGSVAADSDTPEKATNRSAKLNI
jgi:hypothetical protein